MIETLLSAAAAAGCRAERCRVDGVDVRWTRRTNRIAFRRCQKAKRPIFEKTNQQTSRSTGEGPSNWLNARSGRSWLKQTRQRKATTSTTKSRQQGNSRNVCRKDHHGDNGGQQPLQLRLHICNLLWRLYFLPEIVLRISTHSLFMSRSISIGCI